MGTLDSDSVKEGSGEVVIAAEVERFRHQIDEETFKVDELEKKVNEVAQFYMSSNKKPLSKCGSGMKDREKERQILGRKKQSDGTVKEYTCTKRMQELMRQFGTILKQIMQHRYSWIFMEPVDVKSLGLHDYYEVIKKPMDFGTIKNQMEAKDGTRYKHVREICADVRLVFENAMTYNAKGSDVYDMAETLSAKFEERWQQLLPKVIEEEDKHKEEVAESHLDMQESQENGIAKLARDTGNELDELVMHLEEFREMVVQQCRKISTEEKRKLGAGLTRLTPQDLTKALEIIAQMNPNFQASAEEVDIDMDALSESTLWKLKFFVKGALEAQANKTAANKGQENSKRKREICDALAKTAKKRNKKI
ncbi:Transcription factor GTE6 [Acorus calamus]|uniref:Transcription factor GTE6 n=1 Tax=Acorus calamus TaxID=4465 RepID=A0AAV9FNZ7_ACOCL|nr:Transcription factor GTE6 [Acorus calamus]KAK1326508.1 Transcription factor GTE6 [Acorus calamus]